MKFCSGWGLKSKIEFVWAKNPITPFPILPQFLPPPSMHLQWEGYNTTVRRLDDG